MLAAFQKYYEFKNFVELLPYKKALDQSKDSFHEMVSSYRIALLRPSRRGALLKDSGMTIPAPMVPVSAAPKAASNPPKEGEETPEESARLFRTWQILFFCGLIMAIFGVMIENCRLLLCGYYVTFELAYEMIDAGMSWTERR